jgi:hypothetical protein
MSTARSDGKAVKGERRSDGLAIKRAPEAPHDAANDTNIESKK